MPHYQFVTKRVPDVVRLGTGGHREAVKNLYRRTLKYYKYATRFSYSKWDWIGWHIRREFEHCRSIHDPGEILSIMKDCEEALDLWEDPDPFMYPWDGPPASAFNRYPYHPKKRFEHAIASTYYDSWWIESTTDEWYAKQEIEKWRARYIIVFRDATVYCYDYPQWLTIKKRLEEELREKIDDIMKLVNKSMFDYWMDWPYNTIQEFSDGYKPDYKLDIAFQQHWDEQLWHHVAELNENEKRQLAKYQWKDANSLRSIDRYLSQ